jgi:hypothetical protein
MGSTSYNPKERYNITLIVPVSMLGLPKVEAQAHPFWHPKTPIKYIFGGAYVPGYSPAGLSAPSARIYSRNLRPEPTRA